MLFIPQVFGQWLAEGHLSWCKNDEEKKKHVGETGGVDVNTFSLRKKFFWVILVEDTFLKNKAQFFFFKEDI